MRKFCRLDLPTCEMSHRYKVGKSVQIKFHKSQTSFTNKSLISHDSTGRFRKGIILVLYYYK